MGASLTGERPLSGGRPAILRAALRTDAQRIADRYTWHAAWPRAAVFAACRPAPVVAQDPPPVFDCAGRGLILSVFAMPQVSQNQRPETLLRRPASVFQWFFNSIPGFWVTRLAPAAAVLRVRSQDQRDLTTPGYFVDA
jgi:hypothetical protein